MLTAAIKQWKHEFCQDFLWSVQQQQQYSTTLDWLCFSDEAHFCLDGLMNNQNARSWAYENPHIFMKISLHPAKCTVWCAINKQGLTDLIFV